MFSGGRISLPRDFLCLKCLKSLIFARDDILPDLIINIRWVAYVRINIRQWDFTWVQIIAAATTLIYIVVEIHLRGVGSHGYFRLSKLLWTLLFFLAGEEISNSFKGSRIIYIYMRNMTDDIDYGVVGVRNRKKKIIHPWSIFRYSCFTAVARVKNKHSVQPAYQIIVNNAIYIVNMCTTDVGS